MSSSGSPGSIRGFTLVELLVTVAITGIMLTVVAAFFSQQVRVSRETQARNEANVVARTVAEALAQDLKLAGARAVVDGRGQAAFVLIPTPAESESTVMLAFFEACRTGARCVHLHDADAFRYTILYVSSLFLDGDLPNLQVLSEEDTASACRRIDYLRVVDRLYRSDVPCGASPGPLGVFSNLLSAGVEEVQLRFVCSTPDAVTSPEDPKECYVIDDPEAFAREAVVSVTAELERQQRARVEVNLSATMANMRSPARFQAIDETE